MRAEDYPDVYREAFSKAFDGPVTLKFSSNGKAVAFRVELYNYRYAVRNGLPKSKDHYQKIMQIRMSIQDNVLTLQRKKRRFTEKLNET